MEKPNIKYEIITDHLSLLYYIHGKMYETVIIFDKIAFNYNNFVIYMYDNIIQRLLYLRNS